MNKMERLPEQAFEKVMLIDNSDIDNFINNKKLEQVNFARQIEVYNNPLKALETLGQLYEQETYRQLPQLLFLDFFMPEMNGDVFLQELKKNHPTAMDKLPVLMLSGFLRMDVVRELRSNFPNIIGFIEKPLMVKDLAKAYHKVSSAAAA